MCLFHENVLLVVYLPVPLENPFLSGFEEQVLQCLSAGYSLFGSADAVFGIGPSPCVCGGTG
jgi:hypothetical protein